MWAAVVKRYTNNAWGFVDRATVLLPSGDIMQYNGTEGSPTAAQILQMHLPTVASVDDGLAFVDALAGQPPPAAVGGKAFDAGDTTLTIVSTTGASSTLAHWQGSPPQTLHPSVRMLLDIMERAGNLAQRDRQPRGMSRERVASHRRRSSSPKRGLAQERALWENDSRYGEGFYFHRNDPTPIGPMTYPADKARAGDVARTSTINRPVALRDHDEQDTLFFFHKGKLYEARVVRYS